MSCLWMRAVWCDAVRFRYIGLRAALSEELGGPAGWGGQYESLRVMVAISRSALCQLVVASH